MIEQRALSEALYHVLDAYATLQADKAALGLALHRQFDLALALVHGLAGHSGAVLAEAYRREGVFVLDSCCPERRKVDFATNCTNFTKRLNVIQALRRAFPEFSSHQI